MGERGVGGESEREGQEDRREMNLRVQQRETTPSSTLTMLKKKATSSPILQTECIMRLTSDFVQNYASRRINSVVQLFMSVLVNGSVK